jgi:hypothetical protein
MPNFWHDSLRLSIGVLSQRRENAPAKSCQQNGRRETAIRPHTHYIPDMAHNNGSGFRPVRSGLAEASAKFRGEGVTAAVSSAAALTGAEMTAFVPHRPTRPEKSEGGQTFKLVSEYEPCGRPAAPRSRNW